MHVLSDTVAQAATLEFPNLCFQREKKKEQKQRLALKKTLAIKCQDMGTQQQWLFISVVQLIH